ncbi:MAG: hypothetical protein ACJ8AW_27350 [Rhodopila sp.]
MPDFAGENVSQLISESMYRNFDKSTSCDAINCHMASVKQKKRLLKAKIAVALQDELGRVPKEDEINQVFLMARVMYNRFRTSQKEV